MKALTVYRLRAHGACESQVELFKEIFGSSAALTLANVRKARAAGLDVNWIIHLLSEQAQIKFYDARIEMREWKNYFTLCYDRQTATDTAWTAYYKVRAEAEPGSPRCKAASTRLNKKLDAIGIEYNTKVEEAKHKYNLAKTRLLLKFLLKVR